MCEKKNEGFEEYKTMGQQPKGKKMKSWGQHTALNNSLV